jgi:hypothetical protein
MGDVRFLAEADRPLLTHSGPSDHLLRCGMVLKDLSVAVGMLLFAGPAHAQATGVCDALTEVARQAETTGQPQRITLYKSEPMTLACTISGDAVRDGYCRSVIDGISIEFHHIYPWTIERCLRAEGIRPRTEVVRAYTGLRRPGRIDHLTAGLPRGVWLDLRYTPDAEQLYEGQFASYYGRYDLVVWRP